MYVPYWVSVGNVDDYEYFFLMNANNGKLRYKAENVSGYYGMPKFKGYRKMCVALAIGDFFIPGNRWVIFYLLAGWLIPKLQPAFYKMLDKTVRRARSFGTSDRVDGFEHFYRAGVVPLICILTVAAFLYRAYHGLA
jgi:hypothetical protein